MSERAAQNRGTMAVHAQHRFDEAALARYLSAHLDGFAGPLKVVQFRGGQSNPTYLLRAAGGRRAVLRRKPPGKLLPSAHAVEREYRVLCALEHTGVPVPRPRLLCDDAAVIGTPFYVMDYVTGRVFWDLDLPELTAAERLAVYDAMNEGIATLHQVGVGSAGLGDFGRAGGYVARQVGRWAKQYRASETAPIAAMDRLIDWLPAHLPEDEETCIVHGDYRLDNMIFAAEEPRLLAILDWEISTLGHPVADFAYHCMPYRLPPETGRGIAGLDLARLGIPEEQDYRARYCRRTGRTSLPDWEFYLAYNMFRLAAILQGIAGRARDGTAASAHATTTGRMARPLAEAAWAQVEAMTR